MTYLVQYPPEVIKDLKSLDKARANRVLDVIEKKIINGEPEKNGKPLRGELAGCYKIRIGDMRIVYRIIDGKAIVIMIAAGMRRNDEVYKKAGKRV
jgi:mRNA interferase RelE/StbE